jgi:hypothetical protein
LVEEGRGRGRNCRSEVFGIGTGAGSSTGSTGGLVGSSVGGISKEEKFGGVSGMASKSEGISVQDKLEGVVKEDSRAFIRFSSSRSRCKREFRSIFNSSKHLHCENEKLLM